MGVILFSWPEASCSVFSPAFVEVLNCIVLAEQEEPSRKPGPKSLEVDFYLSVFFFLPNFPFVCLSQRIFGPCVIKM